jgi:hypothetical protein
LLTLALLLAFAVLGAILEKPYGVFTKEVAEQAGVASYTGFLAHITWFLWVIAVSAGMLAAAVLWRAGHVDRRLAFFVATSLFTSLLLLDDFAMLHEQWLPRIGIFEEALYAFYALSLVALLLVFWAQFVRVGALLAMAAGAFWAISVASDLIQEHWGIHAHAIEDGAKMIGTALWAAFMTTGALAVLDAGPGLQGNAETRSSSVADGSPTEE